MKKLKKLMQFGLLAIIAVLVLAACGKSSTTSGSASDDAIKKIKDRGKLVVGVKTDTRLFGLKNPKSNEIEGFDIDIAKQIAKSVLGDENKIEFKEVTSNTRIPMLQNGQIDMIIATMTITDERKKQVDFSNVYFKAGQSLLVKKGSSINSVDDLKGKTVLSVKGSTSSINIKKKAPDAKLLEFNNYQEAFNALKAGQGDALTTDNAILYGIADENPDYTLVGGTFTDEPYGIAVKKGNTDLLKEVNSTLKTINDNGEYNKIKDKWIKEDTSK